MKPEQIEADAHALISRGHALLAEAARLRASTPAPEAPSSWVSPGAVYSKRRELELARSGAVESAKDGRRVLIRRRSLQAYVERHRRDAPANDAGEDLFAAPRGGGAR